MVEVKLLELSVDCKAAGGWDSRKSHLKVRYDQVHKISSSLVLGILYCHKLPLFWWVMRSNHLHFVSQRLKDKESLKISCEFVSGHHQPMFFTLIILWVWAWSPPNVHCWLTAWPCWLSFGEWVGGKRGSRGDSQTMVKWHCGRSMRTAHYHRHSSNRSTKTLV